MSKYIFYLYSMFTSISSITSIKKEFLKSCKNTTAYVVYQRNLVIAIY